MNSFSVNFYKTNSGKSPVEAFINSLETETLAKVLRVVDMLELHGPDLGLPYSKGLGKGLFELRVQSLQAVRIFYVFQKGNQFFLLHGFKKTSQKTPKKEIKTALQRQKGLTLL